MKQLKELREAKNMTQTELAERLGVTQGVISQWENGLTSPKLCMVKQIIAELDCTADELIGGEDDRIRTAGA